MSVDWTRWDDDPYWSSDSGWAWRPPWIHAANPRTIRWAWSRAVEPTAEPIDLEEAKAHLRVDFPDDDSLILDLISAARGYVESQYGIFYMPQTLRLAIDRWPSVTRLENWPWPGVPLGSILLPFQPVRAVSAITWYDTTGSPNTLASDSTSIYSTDLISNPARIFLKANQNWPSNDLQPAVGVQVDFSAGYTSKDTIPRRLKQALLLLIGHWYANKEEVAVEGRVMAVEVPLAARAILTQASLQLVG